MHFRSVKLLRRVAALLVGSLLVLAGCSGSSQQPATQSPPSQSEQPQGEKKRGGTLRIVQDSPTESFGLPWEIVALGIIPAIPVVEPLVFMDWEGKVEPKLAERWEADPASKTVTLYLRQGVKFHDGTDFDAEDVRYNLERQKQVGRYPTLESIEVVDPHTVKLHFTQYSNAIFGTLSSTAAVMVSPDTIKEKGEEWAREHPVGTGPFVFVEYQRDSHAKYRRFDDYWDQGKPYVDEIEMRFIQDTQTLRAAFLNKDIDVFSTGDARLASEMVQMGYPHTKGMSGTALGVLLPDSNKPDSPFADKRVREAVNLAIDRKSIAQVLGAGVVEPAYQLAHQGWVHYLADYGEPYDPERARQLLAEAGYPNGFNTKIIGISGGNDDGLEALQYQLQQIGIRAQIELVELTRWQEYRMKGWDGLLSDIYAFVRGVGFFGFFLGENAPSVYASLKRPQPLLDLLQKAQDNPPQTAEEETQMALEMHRIAMEDMTVIPLTASATHYFYQPYVHDTNFLKWATWPWWTPAEVWLDK